MFKENNYYIDITSILYFVLQRFPLARNKENIITLMMFYNDESQK